MAATDEEISGCIIKLLTDDQYYDDKRNKTVAYVSDHFNWDATEK